MHRLGLAWLSDSYDKLAGCSTYGRRYDYHVSCVLSGNCADPSFRMRGLRTVFMDVEVVKITPVKGHTHGQSAAARSSASMFMEEVSQVAGLDPVFFQGSSADERHSRALTREWRWVKDLAVTPALVEKQENDIVVMVDVDYYIDMPQFLGEHFRPVLMYTFQPSSSGKSVGEYKYCFNSQDEVEYSVSGGGFYKHKVWNYEGDSVSAVRRVFGIPVTYSTYALERKMIDQDHQVVLLAPLRKFYGLFAWMAMWRIPQIPIKRFKFASGDFVRMKIDSQEGLSISTSKVGGYLSCTVPLDQDEAIGARSRTMKHKIELSSVKAVVGMSCVGVEVLHEFWASGQPDVSNTVRLLTAVRGYQYTTRPEALDQDAKDGMVAFMTPILDGAFVPKQSAENDRMGIAQRVEIPQRNVRDITLNPFIKQLIDEWIQHKLRYLDGFLVPVDEEVVYEKQNRPTQRRILEKADYECDKPVLETFGKREAYGRVNYQRNITTLPGKEKKQYSRFMYAYTEFIKQMPWYVFGDKPVETARKVGELCEGAHKNALITDYSFYDGSINEIFRIKQRKEVIAVFAPETRAELGECLRKQRSRKGRSRFGVTYDTGDSRLSGSPETSVQNSDDNAFVMYAALRRSVDENGVYHTPEDAWNKLGLVGGDDGLVTDLDPKVMNSTAKLLGLVLKCDEVKRGSVGVTFLSRHYGPDVWYGDYSSMCDVKRILSKFHVTVAMPSNITRQKKLFEKAYALSLTDSNTPIVGPLVRRVTALFANSMTYENSLNIWNGDIDREVHYPNIDSGWMHAIVEDMLPEFDYNMFVDWLNSTDSETILLPPTCAPRHADNAKPGIVECDDDLFEVKPPLQNDGKPDKKSARTKSPTRKHRPRKKKSDRPSRQHS